MRRDVRLLLTDILECNVKIAAFTAGFTLDAYRSHDLVRSAVERQFITIGEAIRRLRYVSGETTGRIDRAIAISGFRNVLVHEYELVDDVEVWRVIQESLPKLKEQIDAWAAELDMKASPERAA